MFCYQCEQTAKGEGCTMHGVCGKDHDVAALQDLLIHATKGISACAHRARSAGKRDPEVDAFVPWAVFTTLTNVNFDAEDFADFIHRAAEVRDVAVGMCKDAGVELNDDIAWIEDWRPADDLNGLIEQGEGVSIENRIDKYGADVAGLQELIVYGLKGAGAYTYHARVLGEEDADLYGGFHELLSFVASEPDDLKDLLAKSLETGELNLRAMELLDAANTGTYGHPEPTPVRVTPVKGKAIVVSGHDLKDLDEILKQTEGSGINVYTHGEMLPCHGYPELNKYDHLVGNYGGAWQRQREEFDEFPGAILMTTNCLMKPKDSYKDRLFTSGPTGWPGVRHIDDSDFSPVIEAALAQSGFTDDGEEHNITVGFGRNAVTNVAEQVVDAVKNGDIRHFFLIGGCDGAKPGRNYYTELAQSVPDDCVILTLACGKYRFNKLEFGDIGGIPRLLDVGQCNDSYSAIQIALALSDAFDVGVNELPLSLVLSWYEQKAVAILLTLLHLGIEDMRLGPTLPAFVEPAVLDVLVDKFNIMPVSTPQEDLQQILGE
ncbi:MAG: hydroxylamine reductase [Planctomycetes bacterium]|nr:hydroxylamine reductase [Planctomycetota bacterium]